MLTYPQLQSVILHKVSGKCISQIHSFARAAIAKRPQIRWLKQQMYFLIVLEARSPKSKCLQVWFPLRCLSLACRWLHSSWVLTWPFLCAWTFLRSVFKFPLLIRKLVRLHSISRPFSHSVMSDSLRPRGLQTPGLPVHHQFLEFTHSCPSSQWCHPTISSSVVPFSSCLQSFPALGSFQMNHFFASGGQSIGVSASIAVLPFNIQDWFPLGCFGLNSLQSKGLSRVFFKSSPQF